MVRELLHVTQVGPVVDLRGDVPQLGARHGVVDGQVLLRHAGQPLEVDIHVCAKPINTGRRMTGQS